MIMKYDKNAISERVGAEKKKFLTLSAFFLAVLFTCCAIMIFTDGNGLFFSAMLIAAATVFIAFRTLKKFTPSVLFSKEVKGENIKEHEINVSGAGGMRMSHRSVVMPNTGANRKASLRRIRGTVYLKDESGNIAEINDLSAQHMNFYEDGDVLLKYAGTKFPIVISRPVDMQPCPLCGRINKSTEDACRTCGLEIADE